MLKNAIKKLLLAVFLLYGFNIISVSFNVIIPINIITIGIISIFDIPGMIMLVLSMFTIF